MYKQTKYFKHLLTATNQHGIHSPFVYHYVTKCLYNKSKYKTSKSIEILLKSIGYFSANYVKVISNNSKITNRINQEYNLNNNGNSFFNIIYFEDISYETSFIFDTRQIHNDTVIIYDNIYKNKKKALLWDSIKQLEKVTVTIDLFYCGVVFFRKEQVKEHFKIRI